MFSFEENQVYGFSWYRACEDLSIHVSFTTVGLILMKLKSFQHFSTSQNSISTLFKKKFKFLGFHVLGLVKTFFVDVSIINVGLILTKLEWFFFRDTDRRAQFWNPHMETCLHTKKKFKSKLKISS